MEYETTRQSGFLAFTSVFLAVSLISAALRFLSNYLVPGHRFGYDDLFVILSLPFLIAQSVAAYIWAHHGLGRHTNEATPSDIEVGLQCLFVGSLMYYLAISLPKFSVLFFYHRVFGRTKKWFTTTLWVLGFANGANMVAGELVLLLQCIPLRANWDLQAKATAKCVDVYALYLATSIISLVVDIAILLAPLGLLVRTRMATKQKLLMCGLFVCGYSVVVITLGRLVTIVKDFESLFVDINWNAIVLFNWIQVEGPVSVMSICLPNIYALVRWMSHRNAPATSTAKSTYNFSTSESSSKRTMDDISLEDYQIRVRSEIMVESSRSRESV